MRKNAGGVALTASKKYEETDNSAPSEKVNKDVSLDNEAMSDVPADDQIPAVGVRLGNVFSEISECVSAQAVFETLQKNKGAHVSELMKRLEPFSTSLPGTPMFINHERKLLYSMMGSPDVACNSSEKQKSRMLSIFGTNSPCDRFNPELFDLVRPINQMPDETIENWNARRVALRNFAPQQSDETDTDWISRCTALRETFPGAFTSIIGTNESAEFLRKSERSKILRRYPALAARIADARFATMFKNIYQGEAKPFGDVSDYWYRVEFQVNISMTYSLNRY